MKANTPELMKFKRLQRILGESRRGTIGLLEGMWIAVARDCPRGDIGRFSDEEIAIMCDWEGDEAQLVEALIETGWLDRDDEHRLVVHDWHEHAPRWVAGNVRRHQGGFATEKVANRCSSGSETVKETRKEAPRDVPKEPPKEAPREPPYDPPPSQAKPSQASTGGPTSPAGAGPPSPSEDEFLQAWNTTASKLGLPTARKLTPKRRKQFRARIRDGDWVANWRECLARLAAADFCRGENRRGWRATLDWFLQPDSLTRVLEGCYGDTRPAARAPPVDRKLQRDLIEGSIRKRIRAEYSERLKAASADERDRLLGEIDERVERAMNSER